MFTLILNGFGDLYRVMAVLYFEAPAARRASSEFYDALEHAARKRQSEKAQKVTRDAMQHSLDHWTKLERKARATQQPSGAGSAERWTRQFAAKRRTGQGEATQQEVLR